MKSKTKFTLMVTAMVAFTFLAIVGIMAIFAAQQQTFNTQITVVYKSTSVEGTASAQWKLGSDWGYGLNFYYSEWQDMDTDGLEDGGETELDLSADGPLSLSPSQSIDLSDENPGVVLKYTFTNSASHPFTLNFAYQPLSATNNINSFYAVSLQEMDDNSLGNINTNFTNTIETLVPGGTTENIYIVLEIDDLGADSIFAGSFNIELIGQTNGYADDYIYLYDGATAMINGPADLNATTIDLSNASYKGEPITKIADMAFSGCDKISSITIGDNITEIGAYAFADIRHLTTLNYNAKNATLTGSYVFKSAGRLGDGVNVTIGDDVINIPANLFCAPGPSDYSPKLATLKLGSKIESVGDFAFSNTGLHFELTIPETVKTIGCGAFAGCASGQLVIPAGVTFIGDEAFGGGEFSSIMVEEENENYTSRDESGKECNCLIDKAAKAIMKASSKTTIPDDGSVTNILSWSFSSCYEMTRLVIPSNILRIDGPNFMNCYELTEVVNKSAIPDDRLGVSALRIIHEESEKGEFETIDNVIYYSYDENVVAVGLEDRNVAGPISLKSGTTSIKAEAFSNCRNLIEISIPSSVKDIGSHAFSYCNSLKNVELQEGLKIIDDYAFNDCPQIISILIPESVENIGNSIFSETYRLTEIINKSAVPDDEIIDEWSRNRYGVRIIYDETEKGEFNTVNGVIYYSYDDNKIAIGLEDANMQDEIILQSDTTSIKGGAFNNYKGFTSIKIPESVTNIGSDAFYGCTSLTSMTIDCGEEVCNNLVNVGLAYSLQVGGTIKTKYEIANLLEWYSNFSKSETQIDGYWVYTNTGMY